MCIGKPFAFDFEDKDSANRMQSSSLELLRCSLFSLISSAKLGIKKTSQKLWNVLGKNWERLGRFWEKTTRFLSSFATFYLILVLLHNNHRTASSHHPEAGSHPICPHPPSQISGS